jgi:hypothetical protein
MICHTCGKKKRDEQDNPPPRSQRPVRVVSVPVPVVPVDDDADDAYEEIKETPINQELIPLNSSSRIFRYPPDPDNDIEYSMVYVKHVQNKNFCLFAAENIVKGSYIIPLIGPMVQLQPPDTPKDRYVKCKTLGYCERPDIINYKHAGWLANDGQLGSYYDGFQEPNNSHINFIDVKASKLLRITKASQFLVIMCTKDILKDTEILCDYQS